MSNPRLIINAGITGVIGATADIGSLQKSLNTQLIPVFNFEPGTGAGQADVYFDDIRALATGANETLDLSGTALNDPFGMPIAFAHIKAMIIYAAAANTTDLTVGNGANPFAGPMGAGANTLILKPGELFMAVRPTTGYPVVNATSDGLKVANAAGATASYTIILVGTSV